MYSKKTLCTKPMDAENDLKQETQEKQGRKLYINKTFFLEGKDLVKLRKYIKHPL